MIPHEEIIQQRQIIPHEEIIQQKQMIPQEQIFQQRKNIPNAKIIQKSHFIPQQQIHQQWQMNPQKQKIRQSYMIPQKPSVQPHQQKTQGRHPSPQVWLSSLHEGFDKSKITQVPFLISHDLFKNLSLPEQVLAGKFQSWMNRVWQIDYVDLRRKIEKL